MHLKIFVVPFFVLMTVVLVIFVIRPEIATMQEKQLLLETTTAQSENMTTLLGNIASLTSDLDNQRESENFLVGYLPRSMDQERVIDMMNFLAKQTGVLIETIDFMELSASESSVPVVIDVPLVTGGEVAAAPLPVAKKQSFSAEVVVKGNYANVKEFFNQVAHTNRYHKTEYFSIVVPEDAKESGDATTLKGTFRANFDYLPFQRTKSALNSAVFTQGILDMTRLTEKRAWVINKIPVLEPPVAGRPNPFQ